MLGVDAVRVLAALMAGATVVGLLAFSRRRHGTRGRPTEFRAEDNPPHVLQLVWPLVILVPQAYPFAVVAFPEWTYLATPRIAFPGDSAAQVAGFLLWGLGGLLVLWSGRELGRFMIIQIAVAKDHELVRTGPYERVRHPTYAGVMCLAIGATLVFLSYLLLAFAIVTVLLANYRARKEERLLVSPEGLGETYRAYMARTGQFLPRIGSRP